MISKVTHELETWHSKNAFSTLRLNAFEAASEIFSVGDAWEMVSRGYAAELSLIMRFGETDWTRRFTNKIL